MRQFTTGIDSVLAGNVPFGAHYIYRSWEDFINGQGSDVYEPVPFLNPLTGETITVYRFVSQGEESQLTNPPGLNRFYHGLELFANKTFFNNKLLLSGSLVYSRLTGNYSGNFFGTSTYVLSNPNTLINREGTLENDRTASWKIVGTYALPWGFNTGFYFRRESGGKWTPVVDLPFEVSNHCCLNILAEPLGSREIPSRTILDLRAEKEFQFYGGQLRFTADVFNVFNSAHPIDVQSFYDHPGFGEYSYTQPRQVRLGIRYTF